MSPLTSIRATCLAKILSQIHRQEFTTILHHLRRPTCRIQSLQAQEARSGVCLGHLNTEWMRLKVCCDLAESIEVYLWREAILCVFVCTGEDRWEVVMVVWNLLSEADMCLRMGRAVHKIHRELDEKDVVVATIDGKIVFSRIVVGAEGPCRVERPCRAERPCRVESWSVCHRVCWTIDCHMELLDMRRIRRWVALCTSSLRA